MSITAGKILTKTIGAVALGMVGYDAYKHGVWQGKDSNRLKTADYLSHVNYNSQLMGGHSTVGSKVKDNFNRWMVDHNVNAFIAGTTGFCKGIVNSLTDNVVPFALALGAVMFKNCDRLCALGLGIYAAKFFFTDMLGLGKANHTPEIV